MSSPVASSSSPSTNNEKLVKRSSSTSAFKRLCQKLSPKQSPRTSTSSSSSSSGSIKYSLTNPEENISHFTKTNTPKAFNEELIQRVFNYIDEDEDGKITAAELRTCMTVVGGREMSMAEAEMAVESADSDGDGMLGLEEFEKLLEGSSGTDEEEELREAFGLYAGEGSGSITAKSLKRMLSRLGQSSSVDSCRAMIRKFDLNGDGVLNFDEFKIMMH